MELTRRGVCYDLETTPYNYRIEYNDNSIIYNFSSEYNKERFINRLVSNREYINNSLSNRFGVTTYFPELCDIKLYSIIEKRGFLIQVNSEYYKCLDKVVLSGMKITLKS